MPSTAFIACVAAALCVVASAQDARLVLASGYSNNFFEITSSGRKSLQGLSFSGLASDMSVGSVLSLATTSTGTTYALVSVRMSREEVDGLRVLATLDADTSTLDFVASVPSNLNSIAYHKERDVLLGWSGSLSGFVEKLIFDNVLPSSTLFTVTVNGDNVDFTPYCYVEAAGALSVVHGVVMLSHATSSSWLFSVVDMNPILGGANRRLVEGINMFCVHDRLAVLAASPGMTPSTGHVHVVEDPSSPASLFGIHHNTGTFYSMTLLEEDLPFRRLALAPRQISIQVGSSSGEPGPMAWTGGAGCDDIVPAVFWYAPLDTPLTAINCPQCTLATHIGGTPYYHPPGGKLAYVKREECAEDRASGSDDGEDSSDGGEIIRPPPIGIPLP